MVDTDWREILSFSQKELKQAEKEELCESLSWMEADDIELNFTDLKTLFRLAQDILKYKNEQVNNLLGQLETAQRKIGKGKGKSSYVESPTKSSDSVLETIAHQEEVIKANKEILEQLYADIAELEHRKEHLEDREQDKDSESSRDALSEMDAVAQLENEVTKKNRHIRKLLSDVKVLEEENTNLKEKMSVVKEKLNEATGLIENLTEQLFSINSENNKLKEALGKSEKSKSQLKSDIEMLRKELFEKESTRENIYEEVKSKVQHWKSLVKSKKAEIEALSNENSKLKEDLVHAQQPSSSPKVKKTAQEEIKIRELQDKLSEATNEIIHSTNLIEILKSENKQLKSTSDELPDVSVSDIKNESDDGKERALINKLKRKNKGLTVALKGAEEMVTAREQELAEITSQLQSLKSEDGIESLLERMKTNKRQLKLKDEGIKNLVQESNNLHQMINDLQLENESMREKLRIPPNEKVPTKGIIKKLRHFEHTNQQITKELRRNENKLLSLEIDKRNLETKLAKFVNLLKEMGCGMDKISEICDSNASDEEMPNDGGGESSAFLQKRRDSQSKTELSNFKLEEQITELSEENEGLRKGLQEILEFLKDNSTTSSGVLALQCPSLETILQSMEARHAAGWFAPHMAAVMALRAALGGKDALLSALHEARKETFDVMTRLNNETIKSMQLEQKLIDIEAKTESQRTVENSTDNLLNIGEFGTWMSEKDQTDVDFYDVNQIENLVTKESLLYEKQLKLALIHFNNKFKDLFDKMTALAIQADDDKNKWSIQEEQYKAQIENLKAQLSQDDDTTSEVSPGIINVPCGTYLQRKCSYLEESYKYIRTLNENMKNEHLETKREAMMAASDYEAQIQRLILSTTNLTDKLRCSIPIDLFWKQNVALNETLSKYRNLVNDGVKTNLSVDIRNQLEIDKIDIMNEFRREIIEHEPDVDDERIKALIENVEEKINTKQLEIISLNLEEKIKQIENLESMVKELQDTQMKLIDETLSSTPKEDVELMKKQLERLVEDNKILKDQCLHVEGQLEIALLQLQDSQQRQMSNDLEVNLLRHQILDLQSSGDNKAILARLSGEVLVAHLQASESHKKIERLTGALNKEKQLRIEADEMLKARQSIFEVYTMKYESKFRYMFEVMQVLRQQYQCSIPLISLENFLNNFEELSRKTHDVNEKLDEIEDLRSDLMIKHSVFNQVLDVSKNKCLDDPDSCPHKLQNIVLQGVHSRELDHCNKKLKAVEQSREVTMKRCNQLEKILLHLDQGFEVNSLCDLLDRKHSNPDVDVPNLQLEDVQSDDENSRKSQTISLPKPQLLKPSKSNVDMTLTRKEDQIDLIGSPSKTPPNQQALKVTNVFVQTSVTEKNTKSQSVQTDENNEFDASKLSKSLNILRGELNKKTKEFTDAITLAQDRTEEVLALNKEKLKLQTMIQSLNESCEEKEHTIDKLQMTIKDLEDEVETNRKMQEDNVYDNNVAIESEKKSMVETLKQFEIDKDAIVTEYKNLLNNEREQYTVSVSKLQGTITELQEQLDRRNIETISTDGDGNNKYIIKIVELEDKCCKLQSELDGSKTELLTYRGEMDRWKNLAAERLTKMEQLGSQLEERHCHEVESYKAENEHWLAQLNETQREHMDLRSRLTEQKASYMKQIAEKDALIEQLRSIVHGLKTQIMNMQTMISINDPSFDLSAIVEVDESDAFSQQSDRLELKFDSTTDLQDLQEDVRVPASSTAIWQEPQLERLRREKQLTTKQNSILRRQIKALAARERRARLDAQNLKNQVFRISTSGGKVVTAESAALHNKISSLQTQLANARRDTHSTVALWDKWKRAQQSSERWQARFEDKCREVKKVETNLGLAKSTIARLEKEKRMLLTRLNECKSEKLAVIEKQDGEPLEKTNYSEPPVSARALLDRVQAQQRRIVALEAAEKGNEYLVSEYEKALAEVTSLKGQVLKLESTLFESQIKTPMKHTNESQPEMEYWKSYCDMLKEENIQLTMKVNHLESVPSTAQHHRVNDLEQTVLTLRGLVSKLQSEQKVGNVYKRSDSRPSSGRSASGVSVDKNRSRLESHRIEIANLKRSIQDKDLLLERSKEMLKIAAEREDNLLRENAILQHQLNELTRFRGGFLSA